MKHTLRLLTIAFLAIVPSLAAQSTIPGFISYQGRVADSTGALVGNGTAVNRTVVFRIWNGLSTTGTTNLLYSERQTVTIFNGEFSVLIGAGEPVTGSPLGFDESGKKLSSVLTDSLWNNSTRFLGVSVYNDGATTATEISPRQQLVAAPFAIKARTAETVVDNGITASMIAPAAITGDRIAPGTITASLLSNASITAGQIANSTITTTQLANATVTAAKLGSDVGVWSTASGNVFRPTGNVGIGIDTPLAPLSFPDTTGGKILLAGSNSTSQNGLSVGAAGLLIHSKTADAINFGTGSDSAFTTNMRLLANGNLGIGTAAPAEKLQVEGTIQASPALAVVSNARKAVLAVAPSNSQYSTSAAAGDAVVRAENGKLILQSGTGAGSIVINTDNTTTFNQKSTFNNGIITNDISYSVGSDTWKIYSTGTNNDMTLCIETQDDGNEPIALRLGNADRLKVWNWGSETWGIYRSTGSRNNNPGHADMYYDAGDPPGNAVSGAMTLRLYNSGVAGLNWRHVAWDGDGNWDFESDIRLKENINDAEPMLDRLLDLKVRRYDWKGGDKPTQQLGVVAQEVKTLFPDVVKGYKFDNGLEETLTVSYDSFGLIAVKSIQELHSSLVEELDAKDRKIQELEQRLQKLERLIEAR